MTDRASVNESAQWALETTAGTAVPANRTVRSMSIEIEPAGDNDVYRPDGRKFASLVIPNQEWATFRAANGRGTYTEICYPLESIFGTATVSSVGSTGKKRVYTPSDTAPDAAKTLTIEKGSAVRAEKIAYGLVTDWGMEFSRKAGATMTMSGIGQRITDGITMTANPSDVPLVPITGKQLDFYIDGVAANLGTTKMLRAFSLKPTVSGKFVPVWAIDSSSPSFGGHVEKAPGGGYEIMLEADATGMAYLTQYRSGDLIFARAEGIGAEFETGHPYKATFDFALGIKILKDLGKDEDGITAVTLDCEFVRDSTWGKAIEVAVTNAVTTL